MAIPERYFLYARKSTDAEDRQVRSIEAQLNELHQIAERDNLTIGAEFIEKQTAKKPGRPIFDEMLSRIEAREADAILAWHPDRLARNSLDGGRIIYLLDTLKIRRLQFYGSWVENTPQGKMILNTEFGFSKYYVDSLSENVKRGHRTKVARGESPCMASFGYLNDHRTKRIVVDRDRAPIVKRAFEMYADGNATLDSLRRFFAENGIMTRPTQKSSGGKLVGRAFVSKMLSNPVYYGHFKWGGEVHPGIHEPIVTKATYDRVQTVLNRRWRWSPSQHSVVPKPYIGLLRCAECGGAITAETQKGHIYYRCSKKTKHSPRCAQPYIREEALDSEITRLLAPYQLPPGWHDEMLGKLDTDQAQAAHSAAVRAAEIRAEIDKLNARLLRLKELLLDGLIDRDEGRKDRAEMLSKRKMIEEKLDALTRGGKHWLEPLKEWIRTAQTLDEIVHHGSLTRKCILAKKVFGSNLVLDRRKAHGKAVNPWALLAKTAGGYTTAHVLNAARTFFQETVPPQGLEHANPVRRSIDSNRPPNRNRTHSCGH